MTRLFISLVVIFIAPLIAKAQTQPAQPLVDAVECRVRGGLPNVLERLNAGGDVRVAYIGGSITEANGWRSQTTKWLGTQFPKAKITEINASVGGTGSELGVFRFRHDVLDQKPDLIFFEFAVNDAPVAPEQIYRTMEGMVRQAIKANPKTDLCFVYAMTESVAGTLEQGKFPRAASAMEKIADHYKIPSIHMGLEVVRLAAANKLVLKANPKTDEEKAALKDKIIFSADGVHPRSDTGHRLYTEAIQRSFDKLHDIGKPEAHTLPEPFDAANYERAQMIPLNRAKLSANWQKLDAIDPLSKRFNKYMPEIWVARVAGDSLTFKFKGTYIGFYDLLGPDCGQFQMHIDDNTPATRLRFDPYSTTHRMGMSIVGRDLDDVEHTVHVELDSKIPDKTTILARRKESIDDPKRFEGAALVCELDIVDWGAGGE